MLQTKTWREQMNTISEVARIKKTIKAIREENVKSYVEKPYTRISGYTCFPLQIEGSLSEHEKECVLLAIESTVKLILSKSSRALQIKARRILLDFTNDHLKELDTTVIRRKRNHKNDISKYNYTDSFLKEYKNAY
jgi:hypothetical protein